MSLGMEAFFVILVAMSYAVAPFSLIYGWIRWARKPKLASILERLSFTGFISASTSAVIAISTAILAQVDHFGFYDPTLMKLMKWGSLFSLVGIVLATGGLFKKSPLRWLAPLCAMGTLAFWLFAAAGE
jgi:hypothetical protein